MPSSSLLKMVRRCLLVMGFVASAPLLSSAAEIPQSWIRYAELVGNQFEAWLAEPDPVAVRFHEFLEHQAVEIKDKPPIEAIIVKVWISPTGKVDRVDFESLQNARADADLRDILTRRPLTESPPPDMRQPLILSLRLKVNAPTSSAQVGTRSPQTASIARS